MTTAKHVIIGGLGNLGRHLQRALLDQGHAVCVLDRPNSNSSLLAHSSVEYIPYTLGQDDSSVLHGALQDTETVYSVVTPDVQHGTVREFSQTNHVGIQQLVDACQTVGVQKLVYGSSLAVTNHLIPSLNESERDPLPPIDSYQTLYDKTKRLGEDVVLAANDHNGFRTCALRLGGILASPNDYMFRHHFESGEKSGRIYMTECQPIDVIAASDVARAMLQANTKLEEEELPGRALYTTKCRKGVTPGSHEIGQYLANKMEWQVHLIPPAVLSAVQLGMQLQYSLAKILQDEEDLPGIPPHVYVDIPKYQQTFDNSLAYEMLDFEPELTWEQAVDGIVEQYLQQQHE